MPVEVIMPKVDMDMRTGKLSVWHVAEGEPVTKGAPLFDIETDKAAMEVESPATGRLRNVVVAPGQTVGVGAPVAWIYAEGEAVGASPPAVAAAPVDAPPADGAAVEAGPPPAAEVRGPAPGVGAQGRLRATPMARRAAREAGLALALIAGTGPRGRIQRSDVDDALRSGKVAAQADARAPLPAPTPLTAPARDPLPRARAAEAGDLHVSTRKGSGAPLLMIHGFAADSCGWTPLERELPSDVPLIRIDLPSHGGSPRLEIGDFPSLARAVTRAFDKLDAGPVHVLAHSLGGGVALALADIRPRQVASLTLISPAGLGPEIDGAALTGIARASRVESLAPWLKRLTATPDGISWDYARAAMLARNDPELREAQLRLAEALFPDGVQSFDLTAALERVTAPAALIWGRSDHIVPWRQALAAPGQIALHLLKGIGHIPQVECPAIVAGIFARVAGQAQRR